jgi:hypothetical protein
MKLSNSDPQRFIGDNGVGRFAVEFEIANNDDVALARHGVLKPDEVRRRTLQGIVDSGAAKPILPQSVVDQLGLPLGREIVVRYADGRTAHRREAENVYLSMLGRHSTFSAIVEPQQETALIGAILLEDLDLLVDCQQQRVIPRDPSWAIYEV